jgi:hypothetical protein
MCGWVLLLLVRSGFGHLLDPPNGLSLFDVLPLPFSQMMVGMTHYVWKDALKGMFSIRCIWNSTRPFQDKVEWWKLVWHKHVIPWFSFILWIAIHDALSTQNTLRCYGIIQTIQCHLCGGDREDVEHEGKCLIYLIQIQGEPNPSPNGGWCVQPKSQPYFRLIVSYYYKD